MLHHDEDREEQRLQDVRAGAAGSSGHEAVHPLVKVSNRVVADFGQVDHDCLPQMQQRSLACFGLVQVPVYNLSRSVVSIVVGREVPFHDVQRVFE